MDVKKWGGGSFALVVTSEGIKVHNTTTMPTSEVLQDYLGLDEAQAFVLAGKVQVSRCLHNDYIVQDLVEAMRNDPLRIK